jgi:heterodisulfide reductase subunit C
MLTKFEIQELILFLPTVLLLLLLLIKIFMAKQILFIISLLLTLGVFAFTVKRFWGFFSLTKRFPIKNYGKRFALMLEVAFGQTKIFRRPVIGLMHALVFWGFCVILIGSIEMVTDGITGSEKAFYAPGFIYKVIFGSGDVFALIILLAIIAFLFRRLFMKIKRFMGYELSHKNHVDAYIALSLILLLMISLLSMNIFYSVMYPGDPKAPYPVSNFIAGNINMSFDMAYVMYEVSWWWHILLIFLFANILPYSKHFHVFLSVPNVFFSRLDPLGKLPNMDNITKEVKLMMNPETAFATPSGEVVIERFGVKDVEDVTWKNYFDSLTCTQCGRCSSVCPANITGKKLSPRKIMMDLRARMNEKSIGFLKKEKENSDNKALLRDHTSLEEIWACTTCNACAKECPVNINQPTLIVDMRRYLVMEESAAPTGLNIMFTNITNNGAPWQFSPEDRMLWAKDLTITEK